jgi:hypothetical protein
MPPEVVSGRYNERSEVFSFGMVLLELLTNTRVAPSTLEMVERTTHDGQHPAGLRSLTSGELEWPGSSREDLGLLVNRCLRRHQQDRPRDMREVLVRLEGTINRATYAEADMPPPRVPTAQEVRHVEEQLQTLRTADGQDGEVEEKVDETEPTAAGETQEARTCVTCDEKVCAGVTCKGTGRHFVCRTCVNAYLHSDLSDVPAMLASHCRLRCPARCTGCRAEPWEPADLSALLDPQIKQSYLEQVVKMFHGRLEAEQRAAEAEAARREEDARVAQRLLEEQVDHHRKQVEDLLLVRCPYPRCRRVFAGYNGCACVTCAAAAGEGGQGGCGGKFCGLCLARECV